MSALPRVHVAIMGMERVVPTLADLAVLLQLLGRSGTGQALTVYTTLLTRAPPGRARWTGRRRATSSLLDNGRSGLRGGRYEEMLACIRCGACLNVCPVYRKAGGAAYAARLLGADGRRARCRC